MAKVVLRQKAIDDLNNIWIYTSKKWSINQADTYYKSIVLIFERIAENPKIGKEYNRIRKNLLGIKSGKHIIFCQLKSRDKIEVIRILHERMDLKNRLGEK